MLQLILQLSKILWLKYKLLLIQLLKLLLILLLKLIQLPKLILLLRSNSLCKQIAGGRPGLRGGFLFTCIQAFQTSGIPVIPGFRR